MSALVKLLIVDDDEVDRRAVRRALDKTGLAAELIEASSAREAREILAGSASFDCILLDYYLPDGHGMDVLQAIRTGGGDVPVVVLTGRGDEELAVELMKAGATDYLTKGALTPGRLAQSLNYARRVHEAQRQAREAEEALRQAVQAREAVLAVVSHDLRNPLNAIATSTALLDATLAPDVSRRPLEIIQRATQQMTRMVDDLLVVSRIESGQLTVERAEHELSDLLDELCQLFGPQAEERSVTLDCRLGPGATRVNADRLRLLQVLANLLSNAIRLTPAGGQVDVEVSPADDGLLFSVRDTGPGIGPDDLPHLFEAFWQAEGSTKGGAGLGLAIAKGIVEAHGGTISVDSLPGRGTTFSFSIPQAPVGTVDLGVLPHA